MKQVALVLMLACLATAGMATTLDLAGVLSTSVGLVEVPVARGSVGTGLGETSGASASALVVVHVSGTSGCVSCVSEGLASVSERTWDLGAGLGGAPASFAGCAACQLTSALTGMPARAHRVLSVRSRPDARWHGSVVDLLVQATGGRAAVVAPAAGSPGRAATAHLAAGLQHELVAEGWVAEDRYCVGEGACPLLGGAVASVADLAAVVAAAPASLAAAADDGVPDFWMVSVAPAEEDPSASEDAVALVQALRRLYASGPVDVHVVVTRVPEDAPVVSMDGLSELRLGNSTQYTDVDAQNFQAMFWTSVILLVIMGASVCAMCCMPNPKDTILYREKVVKQS